MAHFCERPRIATTGDIWVCPDCEVHWLAATTSTDPAAPAAWCFMPEPAVPEYPPPTGQGHDAVVTHMLDTLLRLGAYGLDRSKQADLHAYALACKQALATEVDVRAKADPGQAACGAEGPDGRTCERRARHDVHVMWLDGGGADVWTL